jgi:hypothetical protein
MSGISTSRTQFYQITKYPSGLINWSCTEEQTERKQLHVVSLNNPEFSSNISDSTKRPKSYFKNIVYLYKSKQFVNFKHRHVNNFLFIKDVKVFIRLVKNVAPL